MEIPFQISLLFGIFPIFDIQVGQKGVPGRTPHFAKAKRNISMVYSKTR